MSEILLEGKVIVGSFTGPASLGSDRALLQLTIRDGSDTAQLSRDEVRRIVPVLEAFANAKAPNIDSWEKFQQLRNGEFDFQIATELGVEEDDTDDTDE